MVEKKRMKKPQGLILINTLLLFSNKYMSSLVPNCNKVAQLTVQSCFQLIAVLLSNRSKSFRIESKSCWYELKVFLLNFDSIASTKSQFLWLVS
ncbi:uncharacterized protein BX663DRAFT_506475 [Cokeromyces recurvatus]|uniref:uncharacterized protein n=1 Tax=Cokeromyces recurvatus TaxID=90255 RepID=UPI00221E7171|nr:uncharacterized protein BX663DRAFT_506475 [Cokeromyces recurvatus]KAI7903427.1 hypothetical protein BX663DRAFT_506475 [Cokeromyces recurvatus]